MNKKYKVLLGFLISAFFLYITFRNMDFQEIRQAMREANYWWLIPSQIALWVSLFFRAYRFKLFAQKKVNLRFWDSFTAIMVGYFGNGVLPVRLGEVLKANIISKKTDSSFSLSLGMVFLERIMDLFFMFFIFLMFLSITIIQNEAMAPYLRNTLLLGTLFATIPFVIFFIILLKEELFSKIFKKLIFFLSEKHQAKLEDILKKFLEASHSIKSFSFLLLIIGASFLVWFPIILNTYFLFFCFEGLSGLPFKAAMLTVILIAIGISLPSSPSYIGPYHAATKYALQAYTRRLPIIGSYAILLHISQMTPLIIVGFILFNKENIKINEVQKMKDEK